MSADHAADSAADVIAAARTALTAERPVAPPDDGRPHYSQRHIAVYWKSRNGGGMSMLSDDELEVLLEDRGYADAVATERARRKVNLTGLASLTERELTALARDEDYRRLTRDEQQRRIAALAPPTVTRQAATRRTETRASLLTRLRAAAADLSDEDHRREALRWLADDGALAKRLEVYPLDMPVDWRTFCLQVSHLVEFCEATTKKNIERNEKIAELQAKVAALEARPTLQDRGVYDAATSYQRGDGVTHDGSFWIARCAIRGETPGDGATGWRMAVRRGKPGKDGRDAR